MQVTTWRHTMVIMIPGNADDRLSRISTNWDLLFQVHQQEIEGMEALRVFLTRYCGAVFRYLLAAVRNPDDAEELSQEFALRFIRGDFRRAHPDRGRFRNFLKTALYHMVIDYHRRRQSLHALNGTESGSEDLPSPQRDFDNDFLQHWRAELFDRAWELLAEWEAHDGKPWHTVLSWRVEHPDASSSDLADHIARALGRSCTDSSARQILRRARIRFANCLLDEVARSLNSQIPEEIEAEVIDLGLLPYCRQALRRRSSCSPDSEDE
jgi:DNA-directed RNA polymerase specialized sigma24 family protein